MIIIRILGKPQPQERLKHRIVFPKKKPGEKKAKRPFASGYYPERGPSVAWRESVRRVAELVVKREGWEMRRKGCRLSTAVLISPRRNKDGSDPMRPGDVDNIAKSAMDSLKGLIYEDDQQVAPLLADWIPSSERGGIVLAIKDWTPETSAALRKIFGV